MRSFKDVGLSSQLVEECEKRQVWYNPMKIQTEVIPLALQGKDVFAISPPRTGKAGAYVLSIFQSLLDAGPTNLNPFFACVLSPTKNLAFQIAEYFIALGSPFGVKCAILVETYNKVHQSNQISQQPHIIVGTPGQIFNHLRHTRGFSLALASLKYLVIDDAHMLLNDQSEQQLNEISQMLPSERKTLLFSSTLTEKVHTIQNVCLRNPVKIDLSSKYSIVDTLQQSCSMRAKHKDCYLAYTLAEMRGRTTIVFTRTCDATLLLALILKNLGFRVIPIIIFMSQAKKLESLNAFKSGECNILLCSDRASRELDIPAVDMLINYDVPIEPNDYVYRVGCTAHADVAISLVCTREARQFKMLERFIGNTLPVYPAAYEDVLLLEKRVCEAEIFAQKEMKEFGWKSGGYLEEEDVQILKTTFCVKKLDAILRGSLGATGKLLSCDSKVTCSSPINSLLCKKHDKAANNTPNGGIPSRTLRMLELCASGSPKKSIRSEVSVKESCEGSIFNVLHIIFVWKELSLVDGYLKLT